MSLKCQSWISFIFQIMPFQELGNSRKYPRHTQPQDNLVLSTGLIMWIGHRNEIRKLTIQALALQLAPTKGLTLETSASESLYGGQFTLSTQLIKPNYLVILPPTQHHSFFRNLPPLYPTTDYFTVHLLALIYLFEILMPKWPFFLPFCILEQVEILSFYKLSAWKRIPFRQSIPIKCSALWGLSQEVCVGGCYDCAS